MPAPGSTPTDDSAAAPASTSTATASGASAAPTTVYEARLAERRAELAVLEAASGRFGGWRVLLFVGGLVGLYGAVSGWWPAWPMPLPFLGFALLIYWHGRVRARVEDLDRAARFYEEGLARIRDRWRGLGPEGARYKDLDHLYAEDLDLFGDGSLFQLLCRARTRAGEDALAAWLMAPADPETIRARQVAVEELGPRLALREELARLGEDVHDELDPEALRAWSALSADPLAPVHRGLAVGFAALNVAGLAAWSAGAIPASFGVAPLVLAGVYLALLRKPIGATGAQLAGMGSHLARLGLVLERLEAHEADAPLLRETVSRLTQGGVRPSAAIRRLSWLLSIRESFDRNQMLIPLSILLCLPVHFTHALVAWRARHGRAVDAWLEAAGAFEALLSLASHHFEHPEDVFPRVETHPHPLLEGQGLGHPLLPAAKCKRNDIALGTPGPSPAPEDGADPRLDIRGDPAPTMLVISGSNMSGKSTMLRTVGINCVLALAGGTVRAASLRVTPVAIGASIHILDSLQEGQSHFFAEMARLREIVRLQEGPLPVLFLLDELMHGTNSHDRRIGALAVLRKLLANDALGLVTTHDLALGELAKEDRRVGNAHFEYRMEDGRMVFDYTMRPGVVTASNALEVMRSLGLEV